MSPKMRYLLMRNATNKRKESNVSMVLCVGSRYFQYGYSPYDAPFLISDSSTLDYKNGEKQYTHVGMEDSKNKINSPLNDYESPDYNAIESIIDFCVLSSNQFVDNSRLMWSYPEENYKYIFKMSEIIFEKYSFACTYFSSEVKQRQFYYYLFFFM
jgi:hypothetical protein